MSLLGTMTKRLALLAITGCALSSVAQADQVWKWTDEKTGQTVYSNSPPPKGKKGDKVDILKYPTPVPQLSFPIPNGAAPAIPFQRDGASVGSPLPALPFSSGGPAQIPPMNLPGELPSTGKSSRTTQQNAESPTIVEFPPSQQKLAPSSFQGVVPGLMSAVPERKKIELPPEAKKDPFAQSQ